MFALYDGPTDIRFQKLSAGDQPLYEGTEGTVRLRMSRFICSHERKPRPLGRGGSESASSWVGEEIVLQDLT